MKDIDRNTIKKENIKNENKIKTSADFSWGGNTIDWEERAFDVASRFKSFNGKKKYSLNKSDRQKFEERKIKGDIR